MDSCLVHDGPSDGENLLRAPLGPIGAPEAEPGSCAAPDGDGAVGAVTEELALHGARLARGLGATVSEI